jgi:hypothetical protein
MVSHLEGVKLKFALFNAWHGSDTCVNLKPINDTNKTFSLLSSSW